MEELAEYLVKIYDPDQLNELMFQISEKMMDNDKILESINSEFKN